MSCDAHELAHTRRMLVAQDVDLIQATIQMLPKRKMLNVIDVGAGSGTTALSALQAGPPVRVYSMDVDDDGLHWARQVVSNVGRLPDWDGFVGWNALTDAIGRKKVHFAMIDHEHTEADVYLALMMVQPWLAKNGRVWLHDYGDPRDYGLPSEPYPGVKAAIADACHRGIYEPVGKPEGLGIVLKLA